MNLFTRGPQPILTPTPAVPWASGAVFNPGADLAPDGTLRLIARGVPSGYRPIEVNSNDPTESSLGYADYVSHLGLAMRQPDGSFRLDREPLLSPATEVDRWGLEDARATRLDGTVYLTYTVLSEPAFEADRGVGIGLATTTDWRTVERHGRIGPPVRDKDAALFPQLVGGRIALAHRVVPDIQVAFFEDEEQLRNPGAAYWEDHLRRLDEHVVLRPEAVWEGKKVGIGPPPIATEEGWLVVYHAADREHVYRAGLALLDYDDLGVIARTPHPVMEPTHDYELHGDVPNVVFPQGAVVEDETLTLYYGAADTAIGEASAPLSDVLACLHESRTGWRVPPVTFDFRGHLDRLRDLGTSPVAVERLHGGRPVLEPVAEHAWESRVVLNPAAILVDDADELAALMETWDLGAADRETLRAAGGACVMLYRAQGSAYPRETAYGDHVASALGLAVFTPDLQLVRRWSEPVIAPEAPFHDLGVEDARCTRVGDTYYLHYTGYTSTHASSTGASSTGGAHLPGRVQLCLATTQDFLHWDLRGPIEADPAKPAEQGVNVHDDKNGALFPRPVDGRWFLWHRPIYGRHPMSMHLAEAASPDGPWISRGSVLASYRFGDHAYSWVGAAGPPIALDDGPEGEGQFLALYHQGHLSYEGEKLYNLSALLVDPAAPEPILARVEPILLPEGDVERVGDVGLGVDNVVFSCANYVVGDDLIVPYAGADSRIFGASLSLPALVTVLRQLAVEAGVAS